MLRSDWLLCPDECNEELTFTKGNFLIRNKFNFIFFLRLLTIFGLNLLFFGLYIWGRLYSTSIGCLRSFLLMAATFCCLNILMSMFTAGHVTSEVFLANQVTGNSSRRQWRCLCFDIISLRSFYFLYKYVTCVLYYKSKIKSL